MCRVWHLGQQPVTHARAKYLEQKSRLGPRGPGTSACGESRGPGRTAQKSGTRAPPVGRPDSRGRAFQAFQCPAVDPPAKPPSVQTQRSLS